jgi:2'-5' RNA ligase
VSGWRCFVAIPIGDDLRGDLAAAVERWRALPACAAMKWIEPDAWHLTLAFLGDVLPDRVPGLIGSLADAVEQAEVPPARSTGGVGAFPTAARARVAWYGVDDDGAHLARLAAAVRRRLGLPFDGGPFRPHITLARTRSPHGDDLRPWIRVADAPTGRFDLRTIHLMRSHLGRGPARYDSLGSVALTSAAHA